MENCRPWRKLCLGQLFMQINSFSRKYQSVDGISLQIVSRIIPRVTILWCVFFKIDDNCFHNLSENCLEKIFFFIFSWKTTEKILLFEFSLKKLPRNFLFRLFSWKIAQKISLFGFSLAKSPRWLFFLEFVFQKIAQKIFSEFSLGTLPTKIFFSQIFSRVIGRKNSFSQISPWKNCLEEMFSLDFLLNHCPETFSRIFSRKLKLSNRVKIINNDYLPKIRCQNCRHILKNRPQVEFSINKWFFLLHCI